MDRTKHLETKYSTARYALIKACKGDELRFYLYVKLYAVNKHSAFPSFKAFKIDLGWEKYTVIRVVKMMEKKRRLKVERQKGRNNIYDIIWYDKLNIKGSSQETFTTSGKETLTTSSQETSTQTIRKKQLGNNKYMSDNPTDWNLKTEIQRLLKGTRHIQIIGLWIKETGLKPENHEQVQSIIKRNLRPAVLLAGYSDQDIKATIKALEKTEYISKYTMETVLKYIDEIVASKQEQGKRIIKWKQIQKDGRAFMQPIYG